MINPGPSEEAPSDRSELLLALLAVLLVTAPFALGRGVDVPDGGLYHSVSSWEWVRYA